MIIAQIIPNLRQGGAERFVVDLTNELSLNQEVHLFILYLVDQGDEFLLSDVSNRVVVHKYNQKIGKYSKFDLFKTSWRLFQDLRKIKPRIIHSHINSIVALSLVFLLGIRNCRYFHTVHSEAKAESDSKYGFLLRKYVFRKKIVFPVTISEASKLNFDTFYNLSSILIPNGRYVPQSITVSDRVKDEIRSYCSNENTFVLINLARISTVKRQLFLSKIVAHLVDEGYNMSLLIIGSPYERNIVNEIEALNNPNVHLLGVKNNPLEYLAAADAYCLSSSYEGLPISLLEALAMGCIPVCTPVGGIVNVIKDGVNGFLAKGLSEAEYEDALIRFLSIPQEKREDIKKRCKETFLPYSIKSCAESYLKAYNMQM